MNYLSIKLKNMSYKTRTISVIIALCFISSVFFVYNNYSFYERPIAKVIKTKVIESSETVDMYQNKDHVYSENIVAEIKNGPKKDKLLYLTNKYSSSKAYDQNYHVGDELFVSINKSNGGHSHLTGEIKDVKRDKYVVIVAWVFIFTLIFVGKKQGLFSVISLVVNSLILSYGLDVYLHTSGMSLLLICSISIILFTVISLLLVNGFNEKTYAAILATLLGTFISFLIAYVVLLVTSEKGLHYEEMQFITRPYRMVFLAGLLVGALGAVMDIAITMSSSIFGLYEKNNEISVKDLKISGLEIGKDIMGPMTNILFFAYISGSIPMLILYLKNHSPLAFTLSMNLSLELARALAGGIGIVLTIPIGLYTTIFFINRKRARK